MPAENSRDAGDAGALQPAASATPPVTAPADADGRPATHPREIDGPLGPEPTRYGDWEKNGRCIDF
ncbi:MAG: DUF1674 domain-containing protein [Gammaproteobacteria bacterium]|nr:DUF1674 domain-containing protein [Gammaproteobacteria bacterium]